MFINTKDLSLKLRMYLPILVDLLHDHALVSDSVENDNTKIIAKLKANFIQWNFKLGFSLSSQILCGKLSSVISLFIKVNILKYLILQNN